MGIGTFTMPLKEVIKLTGGTVEIVNGVAKLTGGNIGLQHYTIFDVNYKDHLDGRIIDHFWNREIGVETISMFQLSTRRKMNEIMPYYNKLYLSERETYSALSTIDLHTIMSSDATQTSEAASTSNSLSTNATRSRAVNSDTPQTMLSGNANYASGAVDSNATASNNGEATDESNVTNNAESAGDTRVTGYQGVASSLIMTYRESLINVDMMIINDLEELFMGLWDNGDAYTNNNGRYFF